MKNLLKNTQAEIETTRMLIKRAQSREEVEAHIQHLEELLSQQSSQEQPTLQKPYLGSNQGIV